MKKVLITLVVVVVIGFIIYECFMITTPTMSQVIYMPARQADVSYNESFKDLDTGKVYNLSSDELQHGLIDIKENRNWTEFNEKSYEKIVKNLFKYKLIDDTDSHSKDKVLKPFNFEGSYYCVFDNNTKKVVDIDQVIFDASLNVVVYIFDTSNEIMYKFEYSI